MNLVWKFILYYFLLRINGRLILEGFIGWLNTRDNYLKITFAANGYNHGFNFEWRCSSENRSVLDNGAIDETFLIFSSFRDSDPIMKTFNEVCFLTFAFTEGAIEQAVN